jgi:Skp family chaperone for outer membrane proteins
MSRHRKIAVVAGVVLAALAAGVWRYDRAQGATGRNAERHAVALLDFGRVLREDKHHKDGLAALKAEAAKADERLKRERQKLQAQRAEARQFPADSEERRQREAELDKVEAALVAAIGLQTKTIRKQEADLYYRTYREALAEVASYAKLNDIEVVLRVSSDTVDTGKLESVLAHFNRPVVWSAAEADITSIIIERLNQRSLAAEPLPQGEDRAG